MAIRRSLSDPNVDIVAITVSPGTTGIAKLALKPEACLLRMAAATAEPRICGQPKKGAAWHLGMRHWLRLKFSTPVSYPGGWLRGKVLSTTIMAADAAGGDSFL
jgi:hypothetical protein